MARPAPSVDAPSADDLRDADDSALVAAFAAGRHEAFDIIVERHRRTVYLVCYRFMGNHEDASDLAQDVFVRAFKGLKQFKSQAALSTWLYRVAVNTCLNRKAVRRPVGEPLEAAQRVDDRQPDALQTLVSRERADRLRGAVDQLPPKQRATLVLRVYQDLSHDEIAKILGTSVGAVKANFFHALGNLRRLVKS
ncbi:MAG: sigma-70 family RNA polymerase sigma factor [Vicinamibacterales bacterium]